MSFGFSAPIEQSVRQTLEGVLATVVHTYFHDVKNSFVHSCATRTRS